MLKSQADINKFQEIEKKLDVKFNSLSLLEEGLTHRSYLNEAKDTPHSNERLEFLGDSILSFIVSSHLFTLYPTRPEGELTNFRSAVVKTQTLAQVAQELGLGEYLRLSRGEEEGGGRKNISLLADTFEAIVGAIYMDQGLEKAKQFVAGHLFSKIEEIVASRSYIDFKSELQERVQEKYRVSPSYKVMKEEGPDHAKTFYVGVYVDGQEEGVGQGKSKQEAEQEAASIALEKWRKN